MKKNDIQPLQFSISDVLDDFGIPHRRGRAACPIHGGNNQTSFSFNDEVYKCHACGASGNAVTLVKTLLDANVAGAKKYIKDRFGIDIDRSYTGQSNKKTGHRIPVRSEPIELIKLKDRQALLLSIQDLLTEYFRGICQMASSGQIPLIDFHTEDLKIECYLDEVDFELADLKRRIRYFNEGVANG